MHPQTSDSHVPSKGQTSNRRKSVTFRDDRAEVSDTHTHLGGNCSDSSTISRDIDLEEQAAKFDSTNDHSDKILGDLIRDNLFEPVDDRLEKFLPRNELDGILTEERIALTLDKEGGFPAERLLAITTDIIHPATSLSSSQPHLNSRKQLLAILALLEKIPDIQDFINEGLYDYHLPFNVLREIDPAKGGRRRYVVRTTAFGNQPLPVHLFTKWRDTEIDQFESQQWKVHVPVFSTTPGDNGKPPHYDLAQKAVYPYLSRREVGRGGFSAVDKVEIHTGHTITPTKTTKSQIFAVKRLEASSKSLFEKEVSNLSRFIDRDHPHLIKLLWTFSCGSIHHLVFPCADGNLQDFWKTYNLPPAQKHDHQTVVWLARQCLGIVEGLQMIHQDNDYCHPTDTKRHGVHGDLKPENILWFRDFGGPEEGYSLGTLKISDFGLTGFHETLSKSRINVEGMGGSPTYRAPEYDVYHAVSQSYDIWSLACVLLEFVTWYFKGWEGVDQFSKARRLEDKSLFIPSDTFFNSIYSGQSMSAMAKKSVVKEFQSLYEHEHASDFTIEFVQFVEKGLLRMRPGLRKKCIDLHDTFSRFFKDCVSEPDYCLLKRAKTPPSRKNTELSLLEPTEIPRAFKIGDMKPQYPPRRGSGSQTAITRPGSPLKHLVQEPHSLESQTTKDTTTAGESFPIVSIPSVETVSEVPDETSRPSIERSISRHSAAGAMTRQPQHVPESALSTDTSQDEARQSQSRCKTAVDKSVDEGSGHHGVSNGGDEMQDPSEHGSVKDSPKRGNGWRHNMLTILCCRS